MPGWSQHNGRICALPMDGIDTDQLIPARFMSTPRGEGYGDFLLHDLRRNADGQLRPDFPLNRHDGISILVTGADFGTGSSREAAVYALLDAGIRAVIAPRFGDIFAGNAVNNGLLPARVTPNDGATLIARLAEAAVDATIDLDARCLTLPGLRIGFALDDLWRTKLMRGWDDIDLTQSHLAEIKAYKTDRYHKAPWARPGAPN